jgi:AbrB family looped-hinge helix DNA binding protein
MSKVTSKLQVTVPKTIADQFDIKPGDEIDWIAAGDTIRVVPSSSPAVSLDVEGQLRLFDQSTERNRKRTRARPIQRPADRGWTREDLYQRGRPR